MSSLYWLASYPKSGNTWMRILLSNLKSESDSPVSINDIRTNAIASSRRWLDEALGFDSSELSFDELDALRPSVYQWAARKAELSYHKTHDAWTHIASGEAIHALEATRGAVYLIRNPLDVAISFSHHLRCSIDKAIAHMARDDMMLAGRPNRYDQQTRQKLLTWSQHVTSWVDAPGLRCMVVRYEDMLENPTKVFSGVVRFCELEAYEHRIEKAVRFSAFDTLAKEEAQSPFQEKPRNMGAFFREGKQGSWKTTLTVDQIDQVIRDHGPVMRRFGYLV